MKTTEDYDKHLQEFYASSFREYAMNQGIGENNSQPSNAEVQANKMLKEYGAAVNRGMAKELLKKIDMKSPTITNKLTNYPHMFWETKDGYEMLESFATKFTTKEVEELFEKKELTMEGFKNSLEKAIMCAQQISFKNEKIGAKMFSNFNSNILNVLSHKIELKQIDRNVAQNIYDNAIIQTIKVENHDMFPELQANLYEVLVSRKNYVPPENKAKQLKVM